MRERNRAESISFAGKAGNEEGVSLASPQAEAQKKADAMREEALQKLKTCLNEEGAVSNGEAAGKLSRRTSNLELLATLPV